jgi:hypothetical protein
MDISHNNNWLLHLEDIWFLSHYFSSILNKFDDITFLYTPLSNHVISKQLPIRNLVVGASHKLLRKELGVIKRLVGRSGMGFDWPISKRVTQRFHLN